MKSHDSTQVEKMKRRSRILRGFALTLFWTNRLDADIDVDLRNSYALLSAGLDPNETTLPSYAMWRVSDCEDSNGQLQFWNMNF